ncbi:W2 domain-containing protein [Aphelenchoides besseyi]|nr:W2 domain-containing protein [Aphelenchoides besseyi]
MVQTDAEKKDDTSVLIVADNFSYNDNKNDALEIVNLTLEWICGVQRQSIFVVSSPLEDSEVDEIKKKWKHELSVEFLFLKNCRSFGDVMREVDKAHVVKKEFILIHSVPAIDAVRLNKSLSKFKELRKANKDNVMMLICSQSTKSRYPFVLEKDTNRLLIYNSTIEEVTVVLSKKDFAAGRIVRSDLEPTGIYICGEEFLAQFSDDFDTHSLDYQIRNILEHEEILCQNIHVDVHPFNPPFSEYNSKIFEQFLPFEIDELQRTSCVYQHRTRYPPQCESPSHRRRTISYREDSRESSPDPSESIWPCDETSSAPKPRKSPRARRRKLNSASSSVSASSSTVRQVQHIDAVYETTNVTLQRFDEEVAESMQNCLEAEEWSSKEQQEKLIFEITSSKVAYNIPPEYLTKNVFLAFMRQPKFGPTLAEMKEFTLAWMLVWKKYYNHSSDKLQILHAIEEHAAQNTAWAKYVPNFILFLYNDVDELVTEECAIDWYKNLPENHQLKTDALKKLVDWIQESEEEDSDEEEE